MIEHLDSDTTRDSVLFTANEYPFQPFVHRAVEQYFMREGFRVAPSGDTGLVAYNEAGTPRWVIEVMGKGKKPRTDWALGLSDMLMSMRDEKAATVYALAVPATRNLQEKRSKIRPWVRRALRLHWLVVNRDGSVTMIAPE